jgi:hypothetical protein
VEPLAVKFVLLPIHILAEEGVTVIVFTGFTVTADVCVFEQLPEVPVTVYVVFVVGLAITVVPVVVFNPVDGDHA